MEGRGGRTVQKIAQLSVRVSPEEMLVLRELAAKQSIRLSEFVRRVLAEKAADSASDLPDAGFVKKLLCAVQRAIADAR
jgi:hypothetical protein